MNKEINLINKDDIVINNNTSSEESKEEEILEENQDNNDFKNENLNLENSLESFIENFYSDKIQISKLFFTLGSATSGRQWRRHTSQSVCWYSRCMLRSPWYPGCPSFRLPPRCRDWNSFTILIVVFLFTKNFVLYKNSSSVYELSFDSSSEIFSINLKYQISCIESINLWWNL